MRPGLRRGLLPMVALVASLSLAVTLSSCTPAAAPSPTAAPKPAAPAAEPTKAAAPAAQAPTAAVAQPTAAPKAAAWPEKGKPITFVVPFNAGGGADNGVRVLAASLEKVLGTPVQVVNKAGAGGQVGVTDVAKAKPDGYTVGMCNWATMITLYLDPERKAAFGRKDLQPLALHLTDPDLIAVKADSPYKEFKDLIDAAKQKPGEVKMAVPGILSHEHLALLQIEKSLGVKFNTIQIEGGAQAVPALLGGHVDVITFSVSSSMPSVKGGEARGLASLGKGGDKFVPGVKSMEDLGYKGFYGVGRGFYLPAGTPQEVVDILADGIKKAMDTEEHTKKVMDIGQVPTFLGPKEFGNYWDEMEAQVKPLMSLAR